MITGLIPCAGKSERLHGLPKYLLPLPDGYLLKNVTSQMDRFGLSIRIGTSYISNELLQQYMPTDWLKLVGNTISMCSTLLTLVWSDLINDKASSVVMVMPDSYWTPQADLFAQMVKMLEVSDLVLACWKQRESQRGLLGTVDLDGSDVREVVDKNANSPHSFVWGALAWRPIFWNYVKPEHPHLGIAMNAAISAGLHARAVFAEGDYYDCGTFAGYAELVKDLTEEKLRESI